MTAWFTGVEAIQGATPEWAALPFAGATLLGEVWILVIAMTLAYWFTGRRDTAALFGVSLTALSLVLVLKAVFGLPRPATGPAVPVESVASVARPFYERETTATTYGLPSGHALGATVTWGALAALLDSPSRRWRLLLAGAAIALVGVSRVVLGVHYPVDVVAGTLLGAVVLAVALPACRRLDDPATPALITAVLAGSLAVLVTGGSGPAASAAGAAVGGLVAWTTVGHGPAPLTPTVRGVGTAVVALGVVLTGGIGLGLLAGSSVGPYLGTALVGAGVLAFPASPIVR
jgi:membrane-associated phospholipid phosphatase